MAPKKKAVPTVSPEKLLRAIQYLNEKGYALNHEPQCAALHNRFRNCDCKSMRVKQLLATVDTVPAVGQRARLKEAKRSHEFFRRHFGAVGQTALEVNAEYIARLEKQA